MSVEQTDLKVMDAGGLALVDAVLDTQTPVDEVCARAFEHPGLEGCKVVRLTPSMLATGVDIEMSVLGFSDSVDLGVVAKQKRRTLGFPGWALINDPDHAQYALDVLKEFKKEARRARSKPGFAVQGIGEISKRLGRSVPHFLPSFFEEAGRTFIETGNLNYAAQMFEKARDAERVHALKIDEDMRREAFVEFALAGAVTIKSLVNYAKDLSKTFSPKEAYAHFRKLSIQRTLGGMPPWGTMHKELSKLAKAAGLDVVAEEDALLSEIIESPSLAKGALGFWKGYRKALIRLAKKEPAVRGVLLNLFPSPPQEDDAFEAGWLDMLDGCGALTALIKPIPDQGAAPLNGSAAWFSKLMGHSFRSWGSVPASKQAFELLRRMAPALKQAGEPINCVGGYRELDLDMADLALSLDLAIVDDPKQMRIDLNDWAKEASEAERGRDPVHLITNKNFETLIFDALNSVMGKEPFESLSRGMVGFAAVKKRWLLQLIEKADAGGLPDCTRTINQLIRSTSAHTFKEFPEAYNALCQVQVTAALRRTLNTGIPGEFGWPALEDAVETFECDPGELFCSGAFPYVVVTDKVRAVVVGPTGVEKEFELRLSKGKELKAMRYVDGEVLVIFEQDYDGKGYWTNAPKKIFDMGSIWRIDLFGSQAFSIPGGGVLCGDKVLHVGDTKLPDPKTIISDGSVYWKKEWYNDKDCYREIDPKTGEHGRVSLPNFLETFSRDGMKLDLSDSWLSPLPNGVSDSPFGSKDGLIGFRARETDWSSPLKDSVPDREGESIDGRVFEGKVDNSEPMGLLLFPGDDKPRPVIYNSGWRDDVGTLRIGSTDGAYLSSEIMDKGDYLAFGTTVLPPMYWHLYEARDVDGSGFLRNLDNQTVSSWIGTAKNVLATADDKVYEEVDRIAERLVAAKEFGPLMSAVSCKKMIAGIMAVLAVATKLDKALSTFVEEANPQNAGRKIAGLLDSELSDVLKSLVGHSRYAGDVGAQIGEVSSFFTRCDREDEEHKVCSSELKWERLIGNAQAVAYLAARTEDDAGRDTLMSFLELWSKTAFVGDLSKIRVFKVEVKENIWREKPLVAKYGNDYFVRHDSGYWGKGDRCTVVEHAASGGFKLLDGMNLIREWKPKFAWGTPEDVASFKELLAQKGPVLWDPSAVSSLANATGMTVPEACLLICGLVNIDDYDNNFLPKELREKMGLKVTEAKIAKEGLKKLEREDRAGLFAHVFEKNPISLWHSADAADGFVAGLADEWNRQFGKRVPIPESLLAAAGKLIPEQSWGRFGATQSAVDALPVMASPQNVEGLNEDGKWVVNKKGELKSKGSSNPFDKKLLYTVANYVPYLFLSLKVGDPIRDQIPTVVELARARLNSKDLLFSLGSEYLWDEKEEPSVLAQRALDAIGGKKLTAPQIGRDTGTCIATFHERRFSVFFRPFKIKNVEERKQIEALSKRYNGGEGTLALVKFVLSDAFLAFAKRVENTPVEPGGYEANPLLSVPELVNEVAKKLAIDEDGAVLYLQILTLISPTTKAVQEYNGWKPGRLKKAVAQLASKQLILEAKRARAGRNYFLPGGWEPLKSPHPPLETWKMPLYQAFRIEDTIQVESPIGVFLPLMPLHDLFKAAWQRIISGDAPAYEEVK